MRAKAFICKRVQTSCCYTWDGSSMLHSRGFHLYFQGPQRCFSLSRRIRIERGSQINHVEADRSQADAGAVREKFRGHQSAADALAGAGGRLTLLVLL